MEKTLEKNVLHMMYISPLSSPVPPHVSPHSSAPPSPLTSHAHTAFTAQGPTPPPVSPPAYANHQGPILLPTSFHISQVSVPSSPHLRPVSFWYYHQCRS